MTAQEYTKQVRPSHTGKGSRKRYDDTLEGDNDTMQRRSLGNFGNAEGKPYNSIVPEGVRDSIVTTRQVELVDEAEQPQNSER